MKTFHKGGIHPNANKLTAEKAIETLPMPAELTIILSQSIGAPSKAVVKPGDKVKRGDRIAEAGGFVGAPIHSPADAVVKKLDKVRDAQGLWKDAIILTSETSESSEISEPSSPQDIIKRVGDYGIVGLGGATFPTRVKLSVPEGKRAEILLINGAECEPYLTCDDRLMREHAMEIVEGARLIQKAVSALSIRIGIEENKPEAIDAITKAAKGYSDISVVTLKKKYPQGGEKQLIKAICNREVPDGGLPIDVGCIVDNVATAYAIYDACINGNPLTHRVITVTGKSVSNPGNYLTPIGTPISALIEAAGGIPEDTGKIIAGGPMMGRSISNIDAPVTNGLSGILFMTVDESIRPTVNTCIRCSRCISVCPMGLEPYIFMPYAQAYRWDDAKKHGAMSCIECGSCSYICPAGRPLLDYIKLSKIRIRSMKQ